MLKSNISMKTTIRTWLFYCAIIIINFVQYVYKIYKYLKNVK